jgi:hypothetical protein
MFPASVKDVEKALQVDRVNRNAPVDSSSWDMSEQLIALGACYSVITPEKSYGV